MFLVTKLATLAADGWRHQNRMARLLSAQLLLFGIHFSFDLSRGKSPLLQGRHQLTQHFHICRSVGKLKYEIIGDAPASFNSGNSCWKAAPSREKEKKKTDLEGNKSGMEGRLSRMDEQQ